MSMNQLQITSVVANRNFQLLVRFTTGEIHFVRDNRSIFQTAEVSSATGGIYFENGVAFDPLIIYRASIPLHAIPPDVFTTSDAQEDNENQETAQKPIPVFKHKRYKKKRLADTHESKTYYIEKPTSVVMDRLAGDDIGFKYRFVNQALKLLIHQEYPEYADMLRKDDEE